MSSVIIAKEPLFIVRRSLWVAPLFCGSGLLFLITCTYTQLGNVTEFDASVVSHRVLFACGVFVSSIFFAFGFMLLLAPREIVVLYPEEMLVRLPTWPWRSCVIDRSLIRSAHTNYVPDESLGDVALEIVDAQSIEARLAVVFRKVDDRYAFNAEHLNIDPRQLVRIIQNWINGKSVNQ